MRILHVSDLHLDKSSKDDCLNHVINPLIKTVKTFQEEKPIDLILFTGDLINEGGKSYNVTAEAFSDFETHFVTPLLRATGLDKTRFYFVPGNHDIIRSKDSKNIESGLKQNLTTIEDVNSFFKNPEGINRIDDFKKFETGFYGATAFDKQQGPFESVFKFDLNGRKIGVACLNSAWRCYDSKKDKNQIIIGELQIRNSLTFIEDCDIKIALSHHHFEWLIDFDAELMSTLLKANFHLYFCGHVHRLSAGFHQDPDGQLFTFCAPGILSSSIRVPQRKHDNGFTVVDYDFDNSVIKASFKKGDYPKDHFITNTSIGKEGIWEASIPRGEAILKSVKEQQLIAQIKTEVTPQINQRLLTHSTDSTAPKSIDEIFVMPNISIKDQIDADKNDILVENLNELITSPKNYILFGTKESGKTVLLDKILLEVLKGNKSHHIIPILLDFSSIKDDVTKNIKDFLSISSKETKEVIKNYKMLLLIDNISFDDESKLSLKKLSAFLAQNPEIKFIGTYRQLFEDFYPANLELVSILQFEKLTIKQFKAKHIKLLIKKWFPSSDHYDTPRKLELLTNAFLALNLPRTPLAVSIFLWIIEKQENYKPINNSTLIENFIERVLNKHGRQEVLRERFNYDNKIWLLSEIAFQMLTTAHDDYSLSFPEFTQFIDQYLKKKKFDFSTHVVTQELLEYGIFVEENDIIRFRFTCFFEFFLVKRMQVNPQFRSHVLEKDNFLKFSNEIDYYTGLNRGETDVVKLIFKRLDDGFKELNELITSIGKTTDDLFSPKDELGKDKPSLVSQLDEKNVAQFLPSNKPTEEDLEVLEDQKLDLQHEERGISKKHEENKFKELTKLLILALKVIKNSEEVDEENLKYECYELALKNSISFAILQKVVLELFREHQEGLSTKKMEELTLLDRYLPMLHQLMLFEMVGTQKLSAVIREKIQKDKTDTNISEFEKFLSVFLYSDLRGKNHDIIVSDYIKQIKKSYIEDMVFFKLVTYFYYRSKDEETDQYYLNLIADLLLKSKGLPKERKAAIIEEYRKKKKEKDTQLSKIENEQV